MSDIARNRLIQWNTFVIVQLRIPDDPQSAQLGNPATTPAIFFDSFLRQRVNC